MYVIFSILIFLASILLVGVILIQKSKGGGLTASAGNYNQFMGVRGTTLFIEKATWFLAILICLLSIASSFIAPKLVQGAAQQVKQLPVSEQQATPFETQAPAQQGGAAQQTPAK
ncbi:MAG: preprotein translocase subunit SecG [Sodaliphilus sp.]|nr:preprotein translocase subunit SecG [Sodaliphilus sp.]